MPIMRLRPLMSLERFPDSLQLVGRARCPLSKTQPRVFSFDFRPSGIMYQCKWICSNLSSNKICPTPSPEKKIWINSTVWSSTCKVRRVCLEFQAWRSDLGPQSIPASPGSLYSSQATSHCTALHLRHTHNTTHQLNLAIPPCQSRT